MPRFSEEKMLQQQEKVKINKYMCKILKSDLKVFACTDAHFCGQTAW